MRKMFKTMFKMFTRCPIWYDFKTFSDLSTMSVKNQENKKYTECKFIFPEELQNYDKLYPEKYKYTP